MKKKIISTNKLGNELQLHSIRLLTIKQAFALYKHCLESQIYDETSMEIYSLGLILNEYITNTRTNFIKIQDKYKLPR